MIFCSWLRASRSLRPVLKTLWRGSRSLPATQHTSMSRRQLSICGRMQPFLSCRWNNTHWPPTTLRKYSLTGLWFILQLLSSKCLRVCWFVCGLSPPKRRIVQWRNFACRHVQTMCRTFDGFYNYMGCLYENNDIFLKLHVGLQFCCSDGSVGWLAGCSQGLCHQ